MRLFTLLLLLLSAGACSKGDGGGGASQAAPAGKPAAGDPKADRAAIDKLRAEFAENYSAGDIKRVAAAYAPDAVLIQNFAPAVVGSEAITEFMTAQFEAASIRLTLTSEEVVFPSGGRAVDRGTYQSTISMRAATTSREDRGDYVVVWERQSNGAWKLAFDVDRSTTPPEP
jgi:uncharacterized protein (TIGR02246 family)